MSTFDTGYVGAHRWHVEDHQGSYKYTCTCGDKGNIASKNVAFAMECFARHAHRKLEEAAVSLLEETLDDKDTWHIQGRAGWLREHGETDAANLFQQVVNNREYNEGRRD